MPKKRVVDFEEFKLKNKERKIERFEQIDSNTFRVHYAEDVEISEADVWREKYPDDLKNKNDAQVMEWVTAFQNAANARDTEIAQQASKKKRELQIMEDLGKELEARGMTAAQFIERVLPKGENGVVVPKK